MITCGLNTAHLSYNLHHYHYTTSPLQMLMNINRRGGGVCGHKGWNYVPVVRVSVSIFLGLTDRPINLIYRISTHPLTSSTGLLTNNELLRLGTIGVLVPIAFVLQLLRWQDSSTCTLVLSWEIALTLLFMLFFHDWYASCRVAWTLLGVTMFICPVVK